MSFESAVTFFIAIFIFSVTPGPGVIALLARALRSGTRSCFWLAFGMACSDIVYLILACYGLAAVAHHWEDAFTLIRWMGAAYLIYLGWKMWRTSDQLMDEASFQGAGGKMSFLSGFMISASNPKVILFYIAFLPTFMDVTQLNSQGIALAAVLTLVALMSGLMLVSYAAASARRLLHSPRSARRINRLAASIMLGAGSFLAIKG
ncbi:LysE family translocator [Dongshaea marina]|uniref:LysE family translocator n=1 Tax=Dongshaea marina TaxID=2047966 RepID=UPI000D3E8F92|nr:LysE family translocator [Dongshaea marina]